MDTLERLEWYKYEYSLEVKSQQEAVPTQYDVLQDNVRILVLSLKRFGVNIIDSFTEAEEVFDYIQHQPNMSIGSITSHQLVEELTINHNSPLHVACLLGDLDTVMKVCCCNYIDCTNKVGDTPLHIACRLGHEDICEYISGQIVADSRGSLVGSKTLPPWLYIGLNYKEYTGKVLVSANLPSIFTENEEKLTPFQVALRFQNYTCMSMKDYNKKKTHHLKELIFLSRFILMRLQTQYASCKENEVMLHRYCLWVAMLSQALCH